MDRYIERIFTVSSFFVMIFFTVHTVDTIVSGKMTLMFIFQIHPGTHFRCYD